eukprot:COSAG04_NODE_1062_length_8500_cov_11.838353_5_plen_738_part_00
MFPFDVQELVVGARSREDNEKVVFYADDPWQSARFASCQLAEWSRADEGPCLTIDNQRDDKTGYAKQEFEAQQMLQRFLTSQGHTVKADGVVGKRTRDALIQFQQANGIRADGVMGMNTLAQIQKTKEGTRRVQEFLTRTEAGSGLTADGVMGPNTRDALKQYQRKHGLTVDGMLGANTIEHMEDTFGLQSFLAASGFSVAVDGDFGENADKALREYQEKHGLTVDGVVGPNIRQQLINFRMQTFLIGQFADCRVQPDGVIGPNTVAAIKRYQTENGLKVDGEPGPNTWAQMQRCETRRIWQELEKVEDDGRTTFRNPIDGSEDEAVHAATVFGNASSADDVLYVPKMTRLAKDGGLDTKTARSAKAAWALYLPIARREGYYIQNVIPLNAVIALLGFGVFFYPPEDISDRLGAIFMLLLTSTAFKFVYTDKLPNVDYATRLDVYTNQNLALLLAQALLHVAIYLVASAQATPSDGSAGDDSEGCASSQQARPWRCYGSGVKGFEALALFGLLVVWISTNMRVLERRGEHRLLYKTARESERFQGDMFFRSVARAFIGYGTLPLFGLPMALLGILVASIGAVPDRVAGCCRRCWDAHPMLAAASRIVLTLGGSKLAEAMEQCLPEVSAQSEHSGAEEHRLPQWMFAEDGSEDSWETETMVSDVTSDASSTDDSDGEDAEATMMRTEPEPELAEACLPRKWRVETTLAPAVTDSEGNDPRAGEDGVGVGARAREPRSG